MPRGARALQNGEITGSVLRKRTCLPRGLEEGVTSVFRSCSSILLPSKCRTAQCFLSFDGLTRWTSQGGGQQSIKMHLADKGPGCHFLLGSRTAESEDKMLL